jgi:hypothetical protein
MTLGVSCSGNSPIKDLLIAREAARYFFVDATG